MIDQIQPHSIGTSHITLAEQTRKTGVTSVRNAADNGRAPYRSANRYVPHSTPIAGTSPAKWSDASLHPKIEPTSANQ